MKYLICLDLDGTTLFDDHSLSDNTISYLKEISKKHIVSIVTGRPLRNSLNFYNDLELDTLIANYNGTRITLPSKNLVLEETCIDNKISLEFYNKFKDSLKNIFFEIGEEIYLEKNDDFLSNWAGDTHYEIVDPNTLTDDFNGCVFLVKESSIDELHEFFENEQTGVRLWRKVDDEYLLCELYSRLNHKGTAIEFLKEYYKGKFDEVIAIGDSHNDLDMFKVADISVAMANAKDGIKKHAKFVTDYEHNEDGVIKYLKTIINM